MDNKRIQEGFDRFGRTYKVGRHEAVQVRFYADRGVLIGLRNSLIASGLPVGNIKSSYKKFMFYVGNRNTLRFISQVLDTAEMKNPWKRETLRRQLAKQVSTVSVEQSSRGWKTVQKKILLKNYQTRGAVECAFLVGKMESSVRAKARELGLTSKGYRKTNSHDTKFFDLPLRRPEQFYCYGLLLSDGCLTGLNKGRHRIKFVSKDPQLAEVLARCWQAKIYEWTPEVYRIEVGSKLTYDNLLSLGMRERKSGKEIWPALLEKSDKIWHFIRGFMDGDGSVTSDGKAVLNLSIKFCGSTEFLLNLKRFLENKEIKCSQVFTGRGEKYSQLRVAARKSVEKLYHLLYKNSLDLRLERKYNRFQVGLENWGRPWSEVRQVWI